jgi:hypothetical protein
MGLMGSDRFLKMTLMPFLDVMLAVGCCAARRLHVSGIRWSF